MKNWIKMTPLLFNNKYRIPSARLRYWNYANQGMYFITICTKNRQHYFGEIVPANRPHRSQLRPTEIGQIAHDQWYKTPELRPDMNLELGEFVVMPNHIHGIIIIDTNQYNTPYRDGGNGGNGGNGGVGNGGNGGVGNGGDGGNGGVGGGVGNGGGNGGNGGVGGGGGRDAMHRVSTFTSPNSSPFTSPNSSPFTSPNPSPNSSPNPSVFAPQSKNLASIVRGYKSAVTTYARKNDIPFDWQPRFHDHIIRSMDEYHRIARYIINNPDKWAEDKFYAR